MLIAAPVVKLCKGQWITTLLVSAWDTTKALRRLVRRQPALNYTRLPLARLVFFRRVLSRRR